MANPIDEYAVQQLKEGVNDIYYLTGEVIAAASSSPFLASLRRRDWRSCTCRTPLMSMQCNR